MIKNFRIGVIIRVLLLSATLLLCMYLILDTSYHVSIIIVGAIVIVQIIRLIKYLEQTNALLIRFLDAIKYSDFTGTFRNHNMGRSFADLNKAFSEVMERFKEERNKKAESLRYLETVVQHIGIGILCFNLKGEVVLLNTAAKKLFQVAALNQIGSLKSISQPLYNSVKHLKNGGRNLVRVTINKEALQLAIYATEFRMRDEAYKLVSFQNIHTELEDKEMESWHNLTQVLAHEIMNSITPIASLSGTVHMLLDQNSVSDDEHYQIRSDMVKDVKEALSTINKRSEGLMRFVNSYRDFTQIPEPKYELFFVKETLERVMSLMKTEAAEENIEMSCLVEPKSLELTADPHLIEQVLINLVKNAIRILSGRENGRIHLSGSMSPMGKVIIQVTDNGPGIKSAISEKIFIPFYSISGNSKTKGTGIGLSLSRQIMRLHGGSLTLNSEMNKGSTFTMRF